LQGSTGRGAREEREREGFERGRGVREGGVRERERERVRERVVGQQAGIFKVRLGLGEIEGRDIETKRQS
jgi:hypothetical protein